jgi:hypothetical protein
MSLFVIEHKHAADRCPASDPQMAPMLLKHLSPQNTQQFGITIQAEAVIDNAHTLVMIADAPDQERLQQFMAPFAQVGSVEIKSASPCEDVIERGGCAAA